MIAGIKAQPAAEHVDVKLVVALLAKQRCGIDSDGRSQSPIVEAQRQRQLAVGLQVRRISGAIEVASGMYAVSRYVYPRPDHQPSRGSHHIFRVVVGLVVALRQSTV